MKCSTSTTGLPVESRGIGHCSHTQRGAEPGGVSRKPSRTLVHHFRRRFRQLGSDRGDRESAWRRGRRASIRDPRLSVAMGTGASAHRHGVGSGARCRSAGHVRARAELQSLDDSSMNGLAGVYIKRQQWFRDRWIRHGGYYPKYLLKLFRRDKVIIDAGDLVDHHFYVVGPVKKLRHDLIESNKKEDDISFWIDKHNRYAALLAREEVRWRTAPRKMSIEPSLFGSPDQRVLALKGVWRRMPLYVRPFLYFGYRYFLRLGFLDGKQGADLPFPAGLLVSLSGGHQDRRDAAAGEPAVNILGLNAFHGDASAALLEDGQLVAALEEERLNRIKHWAGFPALAARACLDAGGAGPLEHVAISRDPRAHFWTKVGRAAWRARATGGDRPRASKNTVDVARLARASRRSRASRSADRVARPFRRAPPRASGQRVLRVAVRRSGGRLDRRLRRLQQRDVGRRPRQPHRRARERPLPAFARPVLHRLHAVARVSRSTATNTR